MKKSQQKGGPQEDFVTIVEHLDPEQEIPGGIDSIIAGIVGHSEQLDFKIVGITSDSQRRLGQWIAIPFGGRAIRFLPVARFDRRGQRPLNRLVPHSLLFALGLIRYRRRLISGMYKHAHRIETGLLLKLLGTRHVVQFIHNDSSGLLGSQSDSQWRKLAWLYRLLEKAVMKTAYRVVIFNALDSARLKRMRDDLIVSRTWFDPGVFRYKPGSHIRGEAIEIAWVGRLESQKDPLLALEVIAALRPLAVVRLRIAGDGALKQDLLDRIQALHLVGVVECCGPLTREAVSGLMGSSDVLLMTSQYEGSPVVLLEANSVGLPVVAVPQADPDGALDGHTNGIRTASRSPDEIAEAVRQAIFFDRWGCAQTAQQRSAGVAVPQLMASLGHYPRIASTR